MFPDDRPEPHIHVQGTPSVAQPWRLLVGNDLNGTPRASIAFIGSARRMSPGRSCVAGAGLDVLGDAAPVVVIATAISRASALPARHSRPGRSTISTCHRFLHEGERHCPLWITPISE